MNRLNLKKFEDTFILKYHLEVRFGSLIKQTIIKTAVYLNLRYIHLLSEDAYQNAKITSKLLSKNKIV